MPNSIAIGIGQGLVNKSASSVFSPSQLSPQLWLKGDNGTYQDVSGGTTTPAVANNDVVGTWLDQSGLSHGVTTTLTFLRPALQTNVAAVNGHSTVKFAAHSSLLRASTFTLAAPETVYMCFRQVDWAQPNNFIFDGNTDFSMALLQNNVTPNIDLGFSHAPGTTDATVGTFVILTCQFNGAATTIQVNNLTKTTADYGASTAAGFGFGGTGNGSLADYEVAELIVTNTADSTATQTQVKNYLATRYGLTI